MGQTHLKPTQLIQPNQNPSNFQHNVNIFRTHSRGQLQATHIKNDTVKNNLTCSRRKCTTLENTEPITAKPSPKSSALEQVINEQPREHILQVGR
jgi:hypothetical protein